MTIETRTSPAPSRRSGAPRGAAPPLGRWAGDDPDASVVTETIDSIAGLHAVREEWTELVEASSADTVFLSWEWLATWWRVLGEGELAVACVRRDGRLIGLGPFHEPPPLRTSGGAWALAATRTLRFLGAGQVGSDHFDLPALPDEEEVVAAALGAWLEERGAIVELEQLAAGRDRVSRLLAVDLQCRGWTAAVRESHVCPVADLAGHDWESFVAGLGRSHRQNLRRRLRKIEEGFDVEVQVERAGPGLEQALEILFDLHDRRWDPRGGSDAFSEPGVRRFHREFLAEAAGRGWPRLFVLWLDGKAVAALYGLHDGQRFLFYQSGFDPDFRDHSVGLVLMGSSFRTAIEEGAREYDLLHGDERYKRHWANRSRKLLRRELFPPTWNGRFRHGLRRIEREARGVLREIRDEGGAA